MAARDRTPIRDEPVEKENESLTGQCFFDGETRCVPVEVHFDCRCHHIVNLDTRPEPRRAPPSAPCRWRPVFRSRNRPSPSPGTQKKPFCHSQLASYQSRGETTTEEVPGSDQKTSWRGATPVNGGTLKSPSAPKSLSLKWPPGFGVWG